MVPTDHRSAQDNCEPSATLSLSVIVPVRNEEQCIQALYIRLREALVRLRHDWEIIFVDDGSSDETRGVIEGILQVDKEVRLVELRRTYGQAAAIDAGFDVAKGDIIVTMDGDLQNDPADIAVVLAKLDEGYDAVFGWRRRRKDGWLLRRVPSWAANRIVSWIMGVAVHDLGCGLKAIRRDIGREMELCGGMHRFIAILVHQRGGSWAEVPVSHYPRKFGRSKYSLRRVLSVSLDILTVKFLLDYFFSPMKWFGGLGCVCGAVGMVCLGVTVAMKSLAGLDMTGNPLLLLSALFTLVAVQLISLGIMSEMTLRLLPRHDRKKPYAIRRVRGLDRSSDQAGETEMAREGGEGNSE